MTDQPKYVIDRNWWSDSTHLWCGCWIHTRHDATKGKRTTRWGNCPRHVWRLPDAPQRPDLVEAP